MRARLLVLGFLTGCARIFGLDTIDLPPIDAPIDAAPPPEWLAVVGGSVHTCAIKGDSTLWCWGRNDQGDGVAAPETDAPMQVGIATWREVVAAYEHTCAIQSDQTLWCWGDNANGQLGVGTSGASIRTPTVLSGTWLHVATGADHTCAIAVDGALWCWGANDRGQLWGNVPSSAPIKLDDGPWQTIASGDNDSCAIKADGGLWCWGGNDYGQAGIQNSSFVNTMASIDPAEAPWSAVAMGGVSSCAITATHALRCWGFNQYGQLGDETINGHFMPLPVAHDQLQWTDVHLAGSTGIATTCGRTLDGQLMCWGDNRVGQLANPANDAYTFRTLPTVVPGNWSGVGVGLAHTCAIDRDSHTMSCAGLGGGGQLGDGVTGSRRVPAHVSDGPQHVEAGTQLTCSLASGVLACWGFGAAGGIGIGDPTLFDHQVPAQLGRNDWASVAVAAHVCATTVGNGLACWGNNYHRQLGDNTQTNASTPKFETTGIWAAVAVGTNHTCAIATSGNLECWGQNDGGQAGQPAGPDIGTPMQVGTLGWTAVSAGEASTCGIPSSGQVECFGHSDQGQVGGAPGGDMPGTTNPPIAATQVSAGYLFACALGSSLQCWGYNVLGELGNQTTTTSGTPSTIPGTWTSVSAGFVHACAIDGAGALWCWGDNSSGQLGDGTFMAHHSPTRVAGTDVWTSVSAGFDHTCAVRDDSSVWCWGGNIHGQIGDGTAWRSSLAVIH